MSKKKKNKWFSKRSAAKFYAGIFVGIACILHAGYGFLTKPLSEITEFNLLGGSPIIILVLGIVSFAFANDAYKNQRW
ncbi:MAG: hypothetical protein ACPGLV_01645 [Bacteroidia bacterium]